MSQVPDVVDAFIAAIDPVLTPPVLDGPPQMWPDQDAVIVGWQSTGPGVSVDIVAADFTPADQETITIANLITCAGGDLVVKPVRDRAFTYYDAIAAVIAGNSTLGNTVLNARLSTMTVNEGRTESGVVVEITFAVACLAFV